MPLRSQCFPEGEGRMKGLTGRGVIRGIARGVGNEGAGVVVVAGKVYYLHIPPPTPTDTLEIAMLSGKGGTGEAYVLVRFREGLGRGVEGRDWGGYSRFSGHQDRSLRYWLRSGQGGLRKRCKKTDLLPELPL